MSDGQLTDAQCEEIARAVWKSVGVPDESVLSESERYFISNCAMAFIRAGHRAAALLDDSDAAIDASLEDWRRGVIVARDTYGKPL